MQKIIFTDKTEFEIMPGANLTSITVICSDFSALGLLTESLRKKGNLDTVEFHQDELVTGKYTNLTLNSKIFSNVDIGEDDKVLATFSLRAKTELELTIDSIQSDQLTQDEAIMELAEMIGGE